MKTIGIITYHAPYNYGSTLQAYATQEIVKDLGNYAEIINYRMIPQKDAYALVRHNNGWKIILKDVCQFLYFPEKKKRAENFEKFFENHLCLTDEFAEPEDFSKYCCKYDIIISGSDQIWNKHSNELEHVDWKYMNPYLLRDYKGKKISYASSVGNSTDEELQIIKPYIETFDYISMREKSSADIISSILKRPVQYVVDPTLLISGNEWKKRLRIIDNNPSKPYVLFYSLVTYKPIHRIEGLLKQFASNGYEVRYITPYWQYQFHNKNFINELCSGPIEFLNLINNASIIVTDSFHGTIFSINLNKPFYSINGLSESDFRKTEVLRELGLMKRNITWDTKYSELDKGTINYSFVNQKLSVLREHSINYLNNAIEN